VVLHADVYIWKPITNKSNIVYSHFLNKTQAKTYHLNMRDSLAANNPFG
jgi:hypothetical protein